MTRKKCFHVGFVLTSVLLVTSAAYGTDLRAKDAITAMRAALSQLQTVRTEFCEVKSGKDVHTFDLDYLKQASFNEVVSDMEAVNPEGSPLAARSIILVTYLEKGEKKHLEVYRQGRSGRANAFSWLFAFDGSAAYENFRGKVTIMNRDDFYRQTLGYHGPSKLFSHMYVQVVALGDKPVARRYVDMVDQNNAMIEQVGDRLKLHATYKRNKENGEILPGEDESIRVELDANDFLPRRIECAYKCSKSVFTMEVEEYIKQNGAAYPKRGKFCYLKDGRTASHVCCFIVNEAETVLNEEINDSEFALVPPPGMRVYDKRTGLYFIAE